MTTGLGNYWKPGGGPTQCRGDQRSGGGERVVTGFRFCGARGRVGVEWERGAVQLACSAGVLHGGAALLLQACGMGKSIAKRHDVDSDIENVEGPAVDAPGSQVKSTSTPIAVPSGQFLSPLWRDIETPPARRERRS